MSEIDLFEMEWSIDDKKNNPNINSLSLFQEIERALGENLLEEKSKGDSTDVAFTFIENLTNKLEIEFDKTIGEDDVKQQFIRSLTNIFIILKTLKLTVSTKSKKKNKDYRQYSRKNMVRTKLTVRCWLRTSRIPPTLENEKTSTKERQTTLQNKNNTT